MVLQIYLVFFLYSFDLFLLSIVYAKFDIGRRRDWILREGELSEQIQYRYFDPTV